MANKGTIAELAVQIGADTSDFEQGVKGMQDDIKALGSDMRTMADSMGESASDMREDWRYMSDEMKNAYREAAKEMEPFKKKQQEIEFGFFKMAQGMDTYTGSTAQFMSELQKMGAEHKKLTDDMLKNDGLARASMLENVATIMNMSGQSEKIAANYDRMRNPIYQVNNGLLAMTQRLEANARAGQASVLALKMLGPTANMKQLSDMTTMINRGLMRQQMVMMAAAVASYFLYGALHKAAMQNQEYANALNTMLSTLRQAFQPMVDVFTTLMIHVYNFITYIGQMIIAFNEAHPLLAKMIQGFIMLLPALFLLLSPLAIGIGLVNGLSASFAALWAVISPLVVGLATVAGTIAVIAAVLVAVGAALYLLWNKTDWFKSAVLDAWEAIKTGTKAAWDAILKFIEPALEAIKAFVQDKMNQVKQFWAENGEQIKQAAQNVWNAIATVIKVVLAAIMVVMQAVWPAIKALILMTWEAIKQIINGALDIILGIVKLFATVFTGDWSGAWDAIKQITTGAIDLIIGLMELQFFRGIIKGITNVAKGMATGFKNAWTKVHEAFTSGISKVTTTLKAGMDNVINFVKGLGTSFYNAGKGLVEMMAKGISAAIGAVTSAVSKVAQAARDFLPFSPAKVGPLDDLDRLDFGGPMTDSLKRAVPMVKDMMADLLTLPSINGDAGDISTSFGNNDSREANFTIMLDGRTIGKAVAPIVGGIISARARG